VQWGCDKWQIFYTEEVGKSWDTGKNIEGKERRVRRQGAPGQVGRSEGEVLNRNKGKYWRGKEGVVDGEGGRIGGEAKPSKVMSPGCLKERRRVQR